MTNMTLFSGNKVSIDKRTASAAAAALRDSAEHGRQGGDLPDGGVYVSFSGKLGAYQIGQDKADADPNELWLLNIYGFERGWMCWKSSQPVAKRMASIYSAPIPTPDQNEHGPFNAQRGEGWSQAKAITIKSIDLARQGYYSTSTKSAVNEISKLEAEVARRLESGEPSWPLLMLHKEKFTAQGQTNFKPILKVYGWLGFPQVGQLSAFATAEEMGNNIDRLIEEADDMHKRGVLAQDFDQMTDGGVVGEPEEDGAVRGDVLDSGTAGADDDFGDVEDADVADEPVEEEKPVEAEKPATRNTPVTGSAPVRNRGAAPPQEETTGIQRRRARV